MDSFFPTLLKTKTHSSLSLISFHHLSPSPLSLISFHHLSPSSPSIISLPHPSLPHLSPSSLSLISLPLLSPSSLSIISLPRLSPSSLSLTSLPHLSPTRPSWRGWRRASERRCCHNNSWRPRTRVFVSSSPRPTRRRLNSRHTWQSFRTSGRSAPCT